jgi:hypothetical protein
VTVKHASQPELEVTLMTPGAPLDPGAADFIRRQLEKGGVGGLALSVDDCKTHEELSAKGVTFRQDPSDRPDGVEAVMRDNSGNWMVLVEPKEFSPADFQYRSALLGAAARSQGDHNVLRRLAQTLTNSRRALSHSYGSRCY